MTLYYHKHILIEQTTILQYFCISRFNTSDRENLRVLNCIQIYLFSLFRSAILHPFFGISES